MADSNAVAALFADICARCGALSGYSGDTCALILNPKSEEEVSVHYDDESGLIWLTTALGPIRVEWASRLLTQLLRLNLQSVTERIACSMDAVSATPIVQSWIDRPIVHLGDFDDTLDRHLRSIRELRVALSSPAAELQGGLPGAKHAIWG